MDQNTPISMGMPSTAANGAVSPVQVNIPSQQANAQPAQPTQPISIDLPSTQANAAINVAPQAEPSQDTTASNPASDFISGVLASTPFPRFAASLRKVGIETKDLFGGKLTPDEQSQLINDSYNVLPNGGAVKPIGNPLDAMSVGLQTAGYIAPMGPEAEGANWVKNLLKTSAPFAVLQTLGGAASDVNEGKTTGQTLGDAAMNYLGSVAGFGIFKGMSSGLKMLSGALMKSDIVKSANQAILDFMGNALSLDGRFAKGGAVNAKDADLMTRSLEQSYGPLHKQAMDAFAQTVQQPTTWDDVYRGVQQKVSNVFDNLVKAKDAKYGSVFRDDFFPGISKAGETAGSTLPTDYAKPTFDAMERASASTGRSAIPESGHMSPEEARAFLSSGAQEETPVSKYLDLIQSKIGTKDNPNPLSMKDFDELFTSAPVSRDPIENKSLTDLATSLYQSARNELEKSTDPQAKNILQNWDEARTQWMNLRNMAQTKFADNIKNIGDAQSFVEKVMSSKPTVPVQKIIDQLDPDTKSQMSDIIYNMALQRSRSMNADYSVGGKAVDKMLDNWSPTGLITPQHEAILRSYAEGMQGTYDDLAKNLQGIVGGQDASTAIDTAAQAQAKAKASADLTKAMGGKPLYTTNPDGTFDFSNLTKVVNNINKSGEYDNLSKYLSTIDDLSNTSPTKVNALVKGIFGATLFHAHPFVGLGLISNSLEKFFGKDASKITTADITRLTADLIKTGKLQPEGMSKFLVNMMQGNFKEAGGIIAKLVSGSATQAATEAVNPNPNE